MINRLTSIILTLTFIIWLGGYVFFLLMIGFTRPENPAHKTDAIIVFTGGNNRIITSLQLFAEGLSDQLYISGVNRAVNEKEIRALWRGKSALPKCCITLDYASETTRDNAENTRKWIKEKNFKTIRLVTSDYHLQRALLEFSYTMPEIKVFVHPVADEDFIPNKQKFWWISLSEYNKYILRAFMLASGEVLK